MNLLVEDLSPDSLSYLHVHFNKKLVSYDQNGDGVIVHFEDGSSAHGDILVGAAKQSSRSAVGALYI